MKQAVPAANIAIATLYLLIIIAIGYVIKLTFRTPNQIAPKTKNAKYTKENIKKGLIHPTIQTHMSLWQVLISSYLKKYTFVGALLNPSKAYLLKEIFIISVIFVSATFINRVILWPLALSATFLATFFILMSVFNLPFHWQINIKVDQEKKIIGNEAGSEGIEIEPGILNEHRSSSNKNLQNAKKQEKEQISYKYIVSLAAVCFATLVMATQTMMTIYNSVSNLGALNIGSVASVVAIDQILIRPAVGGIILLAAKIILHSLESQRQNPVNLDLANDAKNRTNLHLFEFSLFSNLCEEQLLQKMNLIFEEHGQPSNYEMGASPTKKKKFSPSKVPKANPHAESETLMNLDITKRIQQLPRHQELPSIQIQDQKQENVESPIKQIELAQIRESIYLTSHEKKIFCDEMQNDRLEINKSVDIQNIQKIKVNPNQYFSVQRLPKDQLHHEEQLEEDGLVLVEAGMNLVKQKQTKVKPNTIDIEFSPTKKRKKTVGYHPKRRQLIITGSSPYLQYLPDMMKKEKQNKKNLTPSSQYQNGMVSRKVL